MNKIKTKTKYQFKDSSLPPPSFPLYSSSIDLMSY